MAIPHIVVVGSINMDLVVRMARLPKPGETVHGDEFQTIPGGKGANQAVAAARLGARVTIIGRVGDDSFGESLRKTLAADGVSIEHALVTAGCCTGVAFIGVEGSGANSITVVAGANGRLTPHDVESRADVIATADVLVMQLETPLDTVAAAIRVAHVAGVRTVLDPAPAPTESLPAEVRSVDLISPNQTEAEAMTGIVVNDVAGAERAAHRLQQNGAREVLLKLGGLGALVCDASGNIVHVRAAQAKIIDTTAAGDAFTAAVAVAMAEGKSLIDAARLGCAAGTLACTKFGAQPAMPHRSEVDRFMA